MFAHPTRLVDWLDYIRAEFEGPSDLRVTTAEACERWPLEPLRLTSLLEALVHAGYLRRSAEGAYFRRPETDLDGDRTRLSHVGTRPIRLNSRVDS